ncbi:uncharacterized protein METZ01_LOCUS357544 [marine metagenome]|uniref:Uncharacterized protein n=1 Tax=marine metagenome TaxID=408172 RepID=A0A382S4C7_9ZZZZ
MSNALKFVAKNFRLQAKSANVIPNHNNMYQHEISSELPGVKFPRAPQWHELTDGYINVAICIHGRVANGVKFEYCELILCN